MTLLRTATTLTAAAVLFGGVSAHAENLRTYEVRITNATRAQVFSPPVLVTHSRDVALFEVGAPALDELAAVAEDGAGQPLADLAATLPAVVEAQANSAPLLPGKSAVYAIRGTRTSVLSAVGMLVSTNDAFFGLNSRRLPRLKGQSLSYTAVAYDAGTEGNNENCAFIPGPACPPDSGNARSTADAEGYVYVHNGVHGIGDLVPASADWRNPVARITITRTR
jgi:hypothetical protein